MKLIIVSNYINHHQIPLANELYKKLGNEFCFIQTQPMEEERVKMGWGSELGRLPYLKLYYEAEKECASLILESDVVLFGGVEDESYIKPRLQAGKIVIRASERLYREGQWKSVSPRGRKKKQEDHTQYAQSPVYLLCHGAYVASDFDIVKAYPQKKFTWGYFPEVKTYDLEKLFFKKKHVDKEGNPCVRLLWAGRFMPLKHPEYAIRLAKDLKKAGVSFSLDMVGGGEEEASLKKKAEKNGLSDCVTFHGFQSPKNVRAFMEEADIFLFTSNHLEGWGAVVNEAMNSACAVVACHAAGAVPTLIKSGQNGLIYQEGSYSQMKKHVLSLIENPVYRKSVGENAYRTMITEWNPKEAATRLLYFTEGLLQGEERCMPEGPLSPAASISPHQYKKSAEKNSRIYVCHTYYHVYVSLLKEMKKQREAVEKKIPYQKAHIALSQISTDFEQLPERLEKAGFFERVIRLDEKKEQDFPQLEKYRKNYNSIVKHMWNRMLFTKMLPKCEEPYLSVADWKSYQDIYVFCDSDPIGYYLNYKKIPYHAVEDGLDCLKNLDDAYVANSGHFKLKTWFSRHNLIFIMNGWGKYCIDMEINDRSVVPTDCPRFVVEPRKPLERALTSQQKQMMLRIFLEDAEALLTQMQHTKAGEEFMMFLTEPHPVDEKARAKVCLDIIKKYGSGYRVLIKPHPRDMIDYVRLCPDCIVLRGKFPIEVLNFIEGIHVKKAVSILTTAMNQMEFVEEKINLGASFWDAYEDPQLHAFNKKAGLKVANEKEVKERKHD